MADNKTDIFNRLRKKFGSNDKDIDEEMEKLSAMGEKKESESVVNAEAQEAVPDKADVISDSTDIEEKASEPIKEEPAEPVKAYVAAAAVKPEESKASESDSETEAYDDIEKNARDFYNSNHEKSIEDRILSIRENAMNTYAKDNADTEESTDAEKAVITSDTIELPVDKTAHEHDTDSEDDENASEKSYDMTQLLQILKTEEREKSLDDDEYNENGITDEHDVKSSYFDADEDYVNEYHHDFEYNDVLQSADLFKSFRKSAVLSIVFAGLTLLFTLLCFWIECANASGLPFEQYMKAGAYGRVYAMVSLQMLALCVLFNLDGLARGIRKMSLKHPAPESVAVAVTTVSALQCIYTAVVGYSSPTYRTFCFIGCFVLTYLSINTFIKAYTRFKAFAMVLSKKPKLSTSRLNALSEENSVFAKYLNEDSEILEIIKSDSVSDFVKNSYTVPKSTRGCNILMYIVLAASITVPFIKVFVTGENVYDAITQGVLVFLLASPVTYLLVSVLPYFVTFLRVNKLKNAIIGEAACDCYENAGVVSFDDTEVFPPKAVKVTSIKTYNEQRIDKVIIYMAKVFGKLGGPLSYVFSNSIPQYMNDSSDVKITEMSKDGLHVSIGDDDVLIGTRNYLRLYDIDAPADIEDENEMRSLTSILYLVIGGQPAAKFYVRYGLNKSFEKVLKGLYDAGICCGVRTCDPGIDNNLIESCLKNSNYPISVIRKSLKDVGKTAETVSGGLIGVSGIHNYLRSFIAVDRLRGIYKTNAVFAVLSAVIGLAIGLVFVFMGFNLGISLIMLFHLFWTVPLLLISLLSK